MAQSLSQLYVHLIFSTKYRRDMIPSEHLSQVFAYMAKIFQSANCVPIQIGGTSNHIHALFLLGKDTNVSTVTEYVKSVTSKWIKRSGTGSGDFAWQAGYCALSVSPNGVERCKNYILNQEEHHKKVAYKDEVLKLLEAYGVSYDRRYLFDNEENE